MKAKLLGFLILLAGVVGAWWLFRSAPVAETREKTRSARVVQTIELQPRDREVRVSAYGTVIASRRLVVRPEVTGRILSQHPSLVPGGRIAAGETLFTIDDSDYRIALRDALTALDEAQAEIDLEQGRRTVAQREYEQLLRDLPEAEINRDLVLREPFRAQAEAALERATAAVAKAELDLSRTTVTAPFNALVIDESVEAGQLADSGSELATLVGADAFWVQASIPLAELDAIRLPDGDTPGAEAAVRVATAATAAGGGSEAAARSGRVVRLLGDLDPAGRLARVLVEVPDPLDADDGSRLLLGSYVRVEIEAGTIEDALEVPRHALREGDRIWVVGAERELAVREPRILWRNDESVFTANVLEPGESLIVSDLTAALPGMAVDPQPATPAAGAEQATER